MHNIKDINPSNIHIVAQNFGPLEKAEITLRPLTIFVGESNTGKTYLSRLICALHRADASLLDGEEDLSKILRTELKNCFGIDSVSELKRRTGNPRARMKLAFKVRQKNQSCRSFSMSTSISSGTVTYRLPKAGAGLFRNKEECRQSRTYYLSANRRSLTQTPTGFLKQNGGFKKTHNGADAEMHRIAKALETEILGGGIEIISPINEEDTGLRYRPASGFRLRQEEPTEAPALRMAHTSSAVVEFAPLVLLLRNAVRPGDLLIIEHPEAHLHPAAQSQLAFTFARLVRAGVRVVVTTHSVWFLQQIGNLIREGELAGLGEKVSEPQGFLKKREVGVWLFQKGSPVEEIKYNSVDGIEPPEYLDVAEGLYNRAAGLQNRLAETKGGSQFERKQGS